MSLGGPSFVNVVLSFVKKWQRWIIVFIVSTLLIVGVSIGYSQYNRERDLVFTENLSLVLDLIDAKKYGEAEKKLEEYPATSEEQGVLVRVIRNKLCLYQKKPTRSGETEISQPSDFSRFSIAKETELFIEIMGFANLSEDFMFIRHMNRGPQHLALLFQVKHFLNLGKREEAAELIRYYVMKNRNLGLFSTILVKILLSLPK